MVCTYTCSAQVECGLTPMHWPSQIARQRQREAQNEKNVTKVAEQLLAKTLGEEKYKQLQDAQRRNKKRRAVTGVTKRPAKQRRVQHEEKKPEARAEIVIGSSQSSDELEWTQETLDETGEIMLHDEASSHSVLPVEDASSLDENVLNILRTLGVAVDV